jgi:hypothetical protein
MKWKSQQALKVRINIAVLGCDPVRDYDPDIVESRLQRLPDMYSFARALP